MKKLTFREVIANIKDGEIWEDENFVISIEDDGNHEIKIRHKEGFDDCSAIFFNPSDKFQLQRKKYSFAEAFKAYEEGKEIESEFYEYRYKRIGGKDMYFCETEKEWGRNPNFTLKEIKGEWYIND